MYAFVILVGIAIAMLMVVLTSERMDTARELVCRWITQNGFRLLEMERRDFFRGPFFLHSGKHQFVYYLEIMDKGGQRRRGYVRVGSFWMGSLTPESITVRWVH